MMTAGERELLFDEETEASWLGYMRQFRDDVYPLVFKQFGFSLPEAFLAWQMNRVHNAVDKLIDIHGS